MSAADILLSAPPTLTDGEAKELARRFYGVDATATPLGSERDQNFRLRSDNGAQLLLKIANVAEDPESLRFENAALAHIAQVAPDFPVPRVIRTVDGSDMTRFEQDNDTYWVRAISWVAGRTLRDVPIDEALRRQLGSSLAELGRALRGFFHPAGNKQLLWDIRHTADLARWLEHIDDPSVRSLCEECIADFRSETLPQLPALRSQVIHNDLNASNVLVSDEPQPTITGVVDFGDMIHGPLVCDVAVGAAYQLLSGDDPLAGAIQFVEAYHRVNPLEPGEVGVLYDLIRARLVTTLIITAWRAGRYPENRDYILRNAHVAGAQLRLLCQSGATTATDRFARTCMPVRSPTRSSGTDEAEKMLKRRQALLGPAYRLFYRRPVHIVRGENVWLYDAQGKAYLDAYNNVPLVGHCHPKVVAALSDQAATLNTHTRYLHDTVLDYAEQLLAMFPADLDRVMFGCTGSEANELALRIARAHTGNAGVIVSQNAYHGNTTAISQLSPSYEAPETRADWVETIPPPDTYRRATGASEDEVAQEFLAEVNAAIDRLASRGIRPAALLLDAGFTSDGMFRAPASALAGAAELVRKAGGIYIADEVQAGFARFGATLWGFELHNVEPEIVTLGKPIGNGHPLAATIVRHDILESFASRGRYFNTFGGNPVSAAVGLAVLDAFHADELARNSRDVGEYLQQSLHQLAGQFDIIGDVRGSGLFAGADLVTDPVAKQHATEKASQVVNDMRERGVLISMIGPKANVLKIRPPLPFKRSHVDRVIETLSAVL